jgi:hypothetical protein
MKAADIAKGGTRLAKLICRYIDTGSLIQNGAVLPKVVDIDSDEQPSRIPRSPAKSERGTYARASSNSELPGSRQPTLAHKTSPSNRQLFYDTIDTYAKGSKRRNFEGQDILRNSARPKCIRTDECDKLASISTAAQFAFDTNVNFCEDDHNPDIAAHAFPSKGEHTIEPIAANMGQESSSPPCKPLSQVGHFSFDHRALENHPRLSLGSMCTVHSAPEFGNTESQVTTATLSNDEPPSIFVKDVYLGSSRIGELGLFLIDTLNYPPAQ